MFSSEIYVQSDPGGKKKERDENIDIIHHANSNRARGYEKRTPSRRTILYDNKSAFLFERKGQLMKNMKAFNY